LKRKPTKIVARIKEIELINLHQERLKTLILPTENLLKTISKKEKISN
jgi:hypothetical protein